MKIEDVMTRNVITVAPEAPLKAVTGTLAEHRISGLPVVDADGTLVGVVSEADVVRQEAREAQPPAARFRLRRPKPEPKLEARTAADAMTSPPIVVGPHQQVSEAARLMIDHSVNRLPVLEDGTLIGIVTRADLVRAFVRSDEEIERELRDDVLTKTLWIDPRTVTIAIEQGVVTLGGELDTRADAELVARFAARVIGVVEVRSRLRWRIDEPKLPSGDPHVPKPPPSR